MGSQSQSQDLEHEAPVQGRSRNPPCQVQSQDLADRSMASAEFNPNAARPAPQPDQPDGSRRATVGNQSDVI